MTEQSVTDEMRAGWAEIEACATRGPWTVDAHEWRVDVDGPLWIFRAGVNADFSEPFPAADVFQVQADAEFIAAAREAVPALLAENAELRDRLDAVREMCRAAMIDKATAAPPSVTAQGYAAQAATVNALDVIDALAAALRVPTPDGPQ